jgi:hypothetical protein
LTATYEWRSVATNTVVATTDTAWLNLIGRYAVTMTLGLCTSVDTISIDSLMTTGIKDNGMETMVVYPNPAADVFNIRIPDLGERRCEIELFDLSGRNVFQRALQSTTSIITISSEELAEGTYLIRLNTADKQYHARLIILKH